MGWVGRHTQQAPSDLRTSSHFRAEGRSSRTGLCSGNTIVLKENGRCTTTFELEFQKHIPEWLDRRGNTAVNTQSSLLKIFLEPLIYPQAL